MTEADEAVAWAAVERISLAIVAYGDLITRHNTEGTLLRNAVEQGALRAGHDKITARRAYAAAARAYSAWSGHGGRPGSSVGWPWRCRCATGRPTRTRGRRVPIRAAARRDAGARRAKAGPALMDWRPARLDGPCRQAMASTGRPGADLSGARPWPRPRSGSKGRERPVDP